MNILECIKQGLFYLDGGTGTFLQARGLGPGEPPELWNLSHPHEVEALHRAYFEAGSHAVCANTFGINPLKYGGDGGPAVDALISAAVGCAMRARDSALGGQSCRYIGLDVGPLGRLLAPYGDLPFEEAVSAFGQVVRAGAAAGVDFIMIETMNDSFETKAALLAAKENCDLPVFVSNVYDEDAKLMSGASPQAMAAMLEGLGADAIGMNCSLGPRQMLGIATRLTEYLSVPMLVKPNAGMPRPDGTYDVDAAEFAAVMAQIAGAGARIIGGCCGTTPQYIRAMVEATRGISPAPVEKKSLSVVSSGFHAVYFGADPVLIGERINPTGKKRLKEALRSRDMSYVLKEGLSQQQQGAHILDVNVGLPEIDEAAMLEACVTGLQSVCTLPLQLDTPHPAAMERAMRVYNGKPMINSVSGKEDSMSAVFPLVKKYGGLVVCLTLDDGGIPETAHGRLAIARKIAQRAQEYGIGINDLIFDPLAMAISADKTAATVALEAIGLIERELQAPCVMGVSNISFGLPRREVITGAFFAMALAKGLKAAIINPASEAIQSAYRSYMALMGRDESCAGYIAYTAALPDSPKGGAAPASAAHSNPGPEGDLENAILRGLGAEAARLAKAALETCTPLELINTRIVPALDAVGIGFEKKTVFLPQLLMSAEAAKAAFEEARKRLPPSAAGGEAVILATVKGDIHDIGKNIVKALMENYGYRVIDLGRDVEPQAIADAAARENVRLVGLSALMTTTVPAMAETIALLKQACPHTKVVVGGAVLTREYADMIGAHHYAKTAMDTVRYAEKVL